MGTPLEGYRSPSRRLVARSVFICHTAVHAYDARLVSSSRVNNQGVQSADAGTAHAPRYMQALPKLGCMTGQKGRAQRQTFYESSALHTCTRYSVLRMCTMTVYLFGQSCVENKLKSLSVSSGTRFCTISSPQSELVTRSLTDCVARPSAVCPAGARPAKSRGHVLCARSRGTEWREQGEGSRMGTETGGAAADSPVWIRLPVQCSLVTAHGVTAADPCSWRRRPPPDSRPDR